MFAAALFAEIVGTVAGFGSSTIFLPLALLFVDFRTALALVAFFHIFGNLSRASFFRGSLDRWLLVRFGLSSVFATMLGALLVARTPQETLKGLLGLFLMLYAIASLWRRGWHLPIRPATAFVGGSLSGFLAGLMGTGGALRGAFLTAFGLPKETYVATAAVIALAVDATRIPIYLAQGFFSPASAWYLPGLFLVALLGSWIGRGIVRRVPQQRFRTLVLVALAAIGAKFLSDWLP